MKWTISINQTTTIKIEYNELDGDKLVIVSIEIKD